MLLNRCFLLLTLAAASLTTNHVPDRIMVDPNSGAMASRTRQGKKSQQLAPAEAQHGSKLVTAARTTEKRKIEPEEEAGAREGEGGAGKEAEAESEAELLGEEEIAKFIIIPVTIAFLMALVASNMLEKYEISWLPESMVVVFIGMGLGFLLKWYMRDAPVFSDSELFAHVCGIVLNLVLLPMLIFESGWSLRHRDFASQFFYILLFACIGSLIAFLVVGAIIFYTGKMGFHGIVMARVAFAYASLISATDPVATLATYSSLKVDALLNIMVFGDSTFNDAVAIVLFKVLNDDGVMGMRLQKDWSGDAHIGNLLMTILGGVVKIFSGSAAIGLGMAALYCLVFRFAGMHHSPKLEILFLTVAAYLTFAAGEAVGMSGIVATIICAIFLGIYGRPHLSYHGSMLGNFFIKQVAMLCDTSVFLLTGVCVVDLRLADGHFALWAMLACLIGRAVAVFPLGLLTNWMKAREGAALGHPEEKWNLLTKEQMFMMWHAGLRGAIALTLCMQLGPWVDRINGAGTRKCLQSATFLIVCVFLLVFGGSTEILLKKLQIPMGEDSPEDKLWNTETDGRLKKVMRWVDTKIMIPVFVGSQKAADAVEGDNKYDDVVEILKQVHQPTAKEP